MGDHNQARHQHQNPSPVYEIHLHSMYDDYARAGTPHPQDGNASNCETNSRNKSGEDTTGAGAAAGGGEPTADPSLDRSSPRDAADDKGTDRGERRTKLLIIAGSAGGWVQIWEAEGLVAAAGVDE